MVYQEHANCCFRKHQSRSSSRHHLWDYTTSRTIPRCCVFSRLVLDTRREACIFEANCGQWSLALWLAWRYSDYIYSRGFTSQQYHHVLWLGWVPSHHGNHRLASVWLVPGFVGVLQNSFHMQRKWKMGAWFYPWIFASVPGLYQLGLLCACSWRLKRLEVLSIVRTPISPRIRQEKGRQYQCLGVRSVFQHKVIRNRVPGHSFSSSWLPLCLHAWECSFQLFRLASPWIWWTHMTGHLDRSLLSRFGLRQFWSTFIANLVGEFF